MSLVNAKGLETSEAHIVHHNVAHANLENPILKNHPLMTCILLLSIYGTYEFLKKIKANHFCNYTPALLARRCSIQDITFGILLDITLHTSPAYLILKSWINANEKSWDGSWTLWTCACAPRTKSQGEGFTWQLPSHYHEFSHWCLFSDPSVDINSEKCTSTVENRCQVTHQGSHHHSHHQPS